MPNFDLEVIQKITELTERCHRAEAERDALAASLRDIRTAAAIFTPSFSREIERRTADPAALLARLKAEWRKGIKQQSRRVRNYSAPDQVFEAIPLNAIDCELRHQAERTMEMNDNCPWRNRLDELLYQLAETIPNLNEPDYYKNELIDRLNELRRQAEGETT